MSLPRYQRSSLKRNYHIIYSSDSDEYIGPILPRPRLGSTNFIDDVSNQNEEYTMPS